jgi:glycerol-3-phosphate O-acyltransferase/dihydroxyacetone phosphate acyltransferase
MGLAYSFIKYFCQAAIRVYFKKVLVIGQENIPENGPLIICGNHSNQFVDPMMILAYCNRKISFTMAASSFSKPVVGKFAKMLNVIPVHRAEDYKIKGRGTIKFINPTHIQVNIIT